MKKKAALMLWDPGCSANSFFLDLVSFSCFDCSQRFLDWSAVFGPVGLSSPRFMLITDNARMAAAAETFLTHGYMRSSLAFVCGMTKVTLMDGLHGLVNACSYTCDTISKLFFEN